MAADFAFRPLREQDLPMLHEWLARPHAAAWWQPTPGIDALRADYLSDLLSPTATRAFIAWHGVWVAR